jgi:hypothetical protein
MQVCSKILPRFQNLRTNVNISVTLQDSSLEVPIIKLRRRGGNSFFMWLLNYENNGANSWL